MAEALKNVITQNLECPVCLNTFTDPKILSCSHTYCKACLDNVLERNGHGQMLRCPVCRAETQVPDQDVSKLPTNLALKSLIEDVKNQHQFCTNCKSEDKPQAVVYCQDCGKYLCITCHNAHSLWQDFISHDVLAIGEIESGKVSVRRYRKCKKHPKQDEECFCSDCRRFACFRCVVMEHKDEGHRVIEAAVYESSHMKSIEDLKSKADKKRSCFQKYVDFIDDQKKHVSNVQKQCTDDINKAYEESVRQLTEKKEILIDEVKGRSEGVEKELDEMKKSAQRHITLLTTIADVVTNITKIPLDMDSLAAHDTLCQDLQEALKQEDPDYNQPMQSSKKGKSVTFERNDGMDEITLGKIVSAVAKNIALPTKNSMSAMVRTPDGRMAVGCWTGGIEIFSADGQHQQKVFKHVGILGVGSSLMNGNTILIATVKHNVGLVSIDEYTNKLKHVQNLIVDYKIEKPERKWYLLQQYRSGEIALCTHDRLYIFD
ncbi:tripartite motif-containing protein 59-like [Strongylocentrotus purpuratus]|uniref:Uncharacterized protein n=1 Tax=Strongylocentrotus purpuratus TaxID=7668 RepID=A0A7M7P3H3_STRPU|nr:tripartite motif-containing protein 59-like [Strongylocentrotus purpuratus]